MLNWNENDVYAVCAYVSVFMWNGAHDTKSRTKMCVYELNNNGRKKKWNETPFSYIVDVHATRTNERTK